MRWIVRLSLLFSGALSLMACCAAGAAAPASSALDILRGSADEGFARALAPRAFAFPRDHGPHAAFRHEWWYVTGNLDSDTGERFGFELTVFRVGLAPPGGGGGGTGATGVHGPGAAAAGATGGGAAGAGSTRATVAGAADGGVGGATRVAESTGHVAADALGEGATRVAGPTGRGAADAPGGGAAGVAGSAGGGPAGPAPAASAWRTREVYAAHFAITDVARGAFKFSERYSRGALGLAGAQAEPFKAWVDDWVLGSTIHAQGQGYELTLDAGTPGDPVLNGDHGLSRKSSEPGAASYYYSIPRITVHGTLIRNGVASNVHGLAWLDREWGSGSLGAKEQGWDWFALQLQDGSALMFYSLRNHDGLRDPNSSGTWVDASGHARPLTADQVLIDISDHWTSPRGGRYPSRWRVRVPSAGLDVEVHPVLADQELNTDPRYWEGAVDLRGVQSGRETTGRGYVELVGYGE